MGAVRLCLLQRSATCVHLFYLYKFALTLNSITRSANGKFSLSHSWAPFAEPCHKNLLLQWSGPTMHGFLFYDYFFFSIPTKVIFIPLVELHSTATDSHMGQWAGISTEVRLLLRRHCYKTFARMRQGGIAAATRELLKELPHSRASAHWSTSRGWRSRKVEFLRKTGSVQRHEMELLWVLFGNRSGKPITILVVN